MRYLGVTATEPRFAPTHYPAGDAQRCLDEVGGDLEQAIDKVTGPAALVIDDAELMGDGPAARLLEGLVRTARDVDRIVVAAATTDDLLLSRFRGWLADMRRSRSGLLLTPAAAADGEVFDLRLPRSIGVGWPTGRAVLAVRGQAVPIQVAMPEKERATMPGDRRGSA